jgi:hypothetical protein
MQTDDFYPHGIDHGDKDTAFFIFNQVKVKKGNKINSLL